MTDRPEETARRRELLKELNELELQAEDQQEAFMKGMAHAHEIVYQNIERMQQSLNDVMGIYMDMPSKLMDDHPSVAELEMGWRVLSHFKERFVDDYDEEFRKHKN